MSRTQNRLLRVAAIAAWLGVVIAEAATDMDPLWYGWFVHGCMFGILVAQAASALGRWVAERDTRV